MHWLNVIALTILLMSGLAIFNAHPALYWGKSSYTAGRPFSRCARSKKARAERWV
jgi:cytochrome b subunit of formate dehydrogenase